MLPLQKVRLLKKTTPTNIDNHNQIGKLRVCLNILLVFKMAGGRPTKYSKWVCRAICMRLMLGESLSSICRRELYPSKRTVMYWLTSNDEFLHHYTQARELQQEHLYDEMFEIADDATNDWMEKQGKNGETFQSFNSENVQRSKLRIDTRKWAMERMAPKKYGTKTAVEHSNPDGNMSNKTIIASPEALNSIADKL